MAVDHDELLVSIHARQYWRAMRASACPSCLAQQFQSTPANTGGRCVCQLGAAHFHGVSIHARQYWRAMPSRAAAAFPKHAVSIHARQYWRAMQREQEIWAQIAQFQSTPANTGGRCEQVLNDDLSPCVGFNPRPPILAGDAPGPPPCGPSIWSFNPRPPILAGDAPTSAQRGHRSAVSIHARQYWRAMRKTPA